MSAVTACVRVPGEAGGRHQEIQPFPTTTSGLLTLRELAGKLRGHRGGDGFHGVYWRPVYYLLEDDFECWLLNAQHLKNVPGRKTDVAD